MGARLSPCTSIPINRIDSSGVVFFADEELIHREETKNAKDEIKVERTCRHWWQVRSIKRDVVARAHPERSIAQSKDSPKPRSVLLNGKYLSMKFHRLKGDCLPPVAMTL